MKPPRVSLKQKLILGVALVHAVLMLGFLLDLVERQRAFLSTQSADATQALARGLATGSASAVLANDVVGMEELVGALRAHPGVEYVMLLGLDGRVLAHSDRRLVGQFAIDDVSLGLSLGGGEARLLSSDALRVDAAAPVRVGPRVIAWARVGRSQHALVVARARALRDGLAYALMAVAIGTLFAWLLARGITSELSRLMEATRRVRAGERGVSVATDRGDELGDLGRAFGEMTVALRDRERALEESERRWLMALDGAGHGVWDWNAQTDHVFYSRAWKEMLGYGDQEFSDTLEDWKQRVHPEDLPACEAALEDHFSGAAPFYRSVHRLRAGDGSYRWVLDQGTVFERTGDGRPLRVVGTHTDITAQKRAEEESDRLQRELDQAHKMEALGQLTGGVAHDFNNILAIIMNNTETARRACRDEFVGLCLDDSMAASRRARDLVAKMLAYSRQTPRSQQSVDPGPELREALRLLAASLPSSIELVTRLEPVRDVKVPKVELHQLVMNLVINARDAIGERGRIEVTLREVEGQGEECSLCRTRIHGEFVELSVADDGQGMSPEVLSRVFDPYFTTKPVGKGTGMGLSVVQGIVRNVSGHVHMTSSPGTGTTVRLLLPPSGAEGVSSPKREVAAPSSLPRAGSSSRVLVVDDEPLVGRALARCLEGRGCEVTVFTDPRAALRAFEARPGGFDVLLTDQTMPDLSGVELSMAVLAVRPGFPVFVCTGNPDTLDMKSIRRSGIRGVFAKPMAPDELFSALEAALHEG